MNYTVTNKNSGKSVTINYIQKMASGSWAVINEDHMKKLLETAVRYQTETLAIRFPDRQPEFTTVDEAYEMLLNTGSVKYDDEWYAEVGVRFADQQEDQKPAFIRTLDCGCTVYSPTHIMQTSYQGTSCPDCYDRIESQGYVRRRR